MMKPNLSIATGLRRLSSEKVSESPFSTGNTSPQTKTSQYLKSSYGDFQTKKQLGSSLKGLLSPVDYKLVEMQTKANALKLDEDTAKPSPKGSARLSGHIILNGNEQSNEIYAKGGLHQKKKSFDSKIDSQYDETLGSKTKLPNTNSMSHTRSQTSTNIYLKDVEYVVNPMFSPVNGPPKYITHRQSDPLADSISPKAIQVKKTSGAQDAKAGLTQEYTLKKESHSAKMMAKSSLNQFFETKKGIAEQRFEEGSSDEYQPGTKSKVTKEKGAQLQFNKMKDGKKSPSMNVSPRVEAYNNLHAYTGANGVKQEFETLQTVKNKSSMGSLYSRQREENQEFSKTATALKNSPKKGASKGVKKDCFFPKAKATDAPTLQNKIKKGEIDLNENEEIHVRPRTTKHSEPNIQKDINTFIFSGFNNQLKRNSAAQIYNSASLVESNLQSTRSAVDRSEKQNFLKEDQKSAKGPGPKPTSAVEIDVKLTSESNAEDAHTLSKKSSVSQLTQNPNAKFMLLRKQVQDKRANRGFKSAGQDMFDLHYYPADLHDKKDQPSSSTKQGSDIHYYLPDTTHTSTKLPGQAQLNEVFARVSKVLETYQRKEKIWEEEKRKLMAEIQMLRGGKQQK